MSLRQDLGQASWVCKDFIKHRSLPAQMRAMKHMQLPNLPRRRRKEGEVWGVTLVKNEADILPLVIEHLFAQGISHIIVGDNMSTDDTPEILEEFALKTGRVHVARDREPAHIQAEKMTYMCHAAWRAGADWIIPFDGDEFWFAPEGRLADYLRAQSADMIYADFLHMVPTTPDPEDLINTEFIVDTKPSFPGKVAVRSHRWLKMGPGNHYALRVGATSHGLKIAHAQYRSPEQVARKVRQGSAATALTGEDLSWFSPHWEAGSKLSNAEILEVWENISHGRPDERIQFAANGPMLKAHPLRWKTWNESGELNS